MTTTAPGQSWGTRQCSRYARNTGPLVAPLIGSSVPRRHKPTISRCRPSCARAAKGPRAAWMRVIARIVHEDQVLGRDGRDLFPWRKLWTLGLARRHRGSFFARQPELVEIASSDPDLWPGFGGAPRWWHRAATRLDRIVLARRVGLGHHVAAKTPRQVHKARGPRSGCLRPVATRRIPAAGQRITFCHPADATISIRGRAKTLKLWRNLAMLLAETPRHCAPG